MPTGLVLTGGGSLLNGMVQLAKERFKIPVRLGTPYSQPSGLNSTFMPDLLKSPIYSTGYGLLLYSLNKGGKDYIFNSDQTLVGSIFKRMKSWITDFL